MFLLLFLPAHYRLCVFVFFFVVAVRVRIGFDIHRSACQRYIELVVRCLLHQTWMNVRVARLCAVHMLSARTRQAAMCALARLNTPETHTRKMVAWTWTNVRR